MKLPSVDELIVRGTDTVRFSLQTIDKTAQGMVMVVDEEGRLLGVVTDGDARRFLLAGGQLDALTKDVMNRNCVSRPVGTPVDDLIKLLSDGRIRNIPLIDDGGRPVDYACPHRLHRLQVAEPALTGNELLYVTECVRTNWISSQGQFVRKFEEMFAEYCGLPNALAVSNGTVALHLALEALDIGKGDEVIVPDFTFAASINAVLYTGATPVLVDVDPYTWTLDVKQVENALTQNTRAIMAVHIYGHPCDMDELRRIAEKRGLFIIEDAAEALGSEYKGKPVGGLADAAAFSFFGNKTVTTGEGGMLLLKDSSRAERARRLRDHGMAKGRRYWHDEVGYNYRMTNVQAAIGVAQMERVEELVSSKQRLGKKYNELVSDISEVTTPPEATWARSSYWLYTLMLSGNKVLSRDELISKLLLNGIETRPTFYPLHEMPPYREFGRGMSFPNALFLSKAGISLPSGVAMKDEELESVVRALKSVIGVRKLVMS